MKFDLKFPRASTLKPATGLIKKQAQEFYVEELMNPELAGEGEHVWLWVEKIGQNTEYVAGQLARFANVKKMDIGFSGQKDRWAKTRQWFSVYLGAKPEPDWPSFDLEDTCILKVGRHVKKLRRGEHRANFFNIVVQELSDTDDLQSSLSKIHDGGFPNYYGPQRFGINGANLDRGERFFEGEIKASRSQRSFYLSAARSYLFNISLAQMVESGLWSDDTVGGPLFGDDVEGVTSISENERKILESHPSLAKGIHKNRLKLERRSYSIVPQDFTWKLCDGNKLTLTFVLPKGIFATALLAEFLNFRVGLGQGE